MKKKNFRKLFLAETLVLTAVLGLTVSGCGEPVNEDAFPAANMVDTADIDTGTFSESTLPETTVTTTSETTLPRELRVSFTALGDNLIHSAIYNQAARRAENEGEYDFSHAYAGVAGLLDNADITVLNQETLICGDEYGLSTYPCFNSPEALGEYMAELGVDVFTIANNHTLDKGEKGLRDCLEYYDEHGFVRVGAYIDRSDRENIRTVEANGVIVSFLSYTESLNGLSLSGETPLEIGRTQDLEVIKSEIAAAREISDICVVSLHWGLENSSETEDYQRSAARELGEAGADVIIGNHPHVLREIETFENSDGRETICAYSLGNFISAQSVGTNLIGGILNFEVSLGTEGDKTPAKIEGIEFIPIITHYDTNYANVRLYKLSDYNADLAAAHGVRAFTGFSYDYITEYLEKQGLDEFMKS
ncbi:MAG: CapA family protein [Oscillospiraceae bacterium]|nr:CapA family protein [Oscillospiraceae bacterium]